LKQIDLREGARRQHRAVGLLAVVQCWVRRLDGLVLRRSHLQRLLGLARFKETRLDWLRADLGEYFPYQAVFVSKGESLSSLFLARGSLEGMSYATMHDERRIATIPRDGPRLAVFRLWKRPRPAENFRETDALRVWAAASGNSDERLMTSVLALLASGQLSLNEVPGMPTEREVD